MAMWTGRDGFWMRMREIVGAGAGHDARARAREEEK